jgi:hypothetical protein
MYFRTLEYALLYLSNLSSSWVRVPGLNLRLVLPLVAVCGQWSMAPTLQTALLGQQTVREM